MQVNFEAKNGDTVQEYCVACAEHKSQRKNSYLSRNPPCKQNTSNVLRTAKEYAEKNEVADVVVVASTTGETGAKAAKLFKDFNLVIVTHHSGFSKLGFQELKEKNRQQILTQGAKILRATHAISGGQKGDSQKVWHNRIS